MEDKSKAFQRRVRTHVTGPLHRLAVVVPQEVAPVCLREVESLGVQGAEITEAGVEFSGKLKDAYACNLWLRTASRVLCRLSEFRAGVSEELFYKVTQIPWELWIDPVLPLDIESHVEYSRISHEGKAAELLGDGIRKVFRDRGIVMESPPEGGVGDRAETQRIILRLVRNHCLIGLDTTGAHLHERGYRSMHSGAPVRETLAAAILMRAAWSGDRPLIDGMCGAGTFPIEAALIARKAPPGRFRKFLFERWPSFQKPTWDYMRKVAEEDALEKSPARLIGIDRDPQAVLIAGENGKRAGVGGDISWREGDFFDFRPAAEKVEPGLLVLNPPYGKRLEGGGKPFYRELGAHLRKHYRDWQFAVLAPSHSDAAAMRAGPTRMWSVRHGGLHISVAFGRVPA